jgi:CBS domain-containing protein
MNREAVIVLVSPLAHGALEMTLRGRYAEGYRIHVTPPDADPDAPLRALLNRGEQVAMFVYEGGQGTAYLDQCRAVYPDARKLMLAAAFSSDLANAVDHLADTWLPPETQLYPVLDELLADWRASMNTLALVGGIMTLRTVRIRMDDTLHRAAEVIALSGVGDLMVIDQDNRFVGVLSVGDVLRAAMPDVDEILDEGGTLEQAFRLFLRKGSELMYKPVAPLVITSPLTVSPSDHVAKAAAIMLERNIHRLPVVEDGRLVGTVGRTDICQAVVGTL